MSSISRVHNTSTFNIHSDSPSETALPGFPHGATAHTTQAAGIIEALSSSHGLGGRIVRFLITTWQDFSFWARSIMGTVTAAEIQSFNSERLSRINSSILHGLSNEEAIKFLTWAREDDNRLMGLMPAIIKNIKPSKVNTLITHIRFSFLEKLAASNPCIFKKYTNLKFLHARMPGHYLMTAHYFMSTPAKITALIPALKSLAEADPSEFSAWFKEMMTDKNNFFRLTPMDMAMVDAARITAFMPILKLLAETDPSSFHDTFKEMMTDRDDFSSTPMHDVMMNAASINAFTPVLQLLAEATEATSSSFHDTLKEILTRKNLTDITPTHWAMADTARITAFMPFLKLLAETDPSSSYDTLKEILMSTKHDDKTLWQRFILTILFTPNDNVPPMHLIARNVNRVRAFLPLVKKLSELGMDTKDLNEIMQADAGNGQTLIQKMLYELPKDEFKSFLRSTALNANYSSQTGIVSLH